MDKLEFRKMFVDKQYSFGVIYPKKPFVVNFKNGKQLVAEMVDFYSASRLDSDIALLRMTSGEYNRAKISNIVDVTFLNENKESE